MRTHISHQSNEINQRKKLNVINQERKRKGELIEEPRTLRNRIFGIPLIPRDLAKSSMGSCLISKTSLLGMRYTERKYDRNA